ncbi:MAG: hypothetical protein ACYS1A_04435 [Planctomycetota bacterium]|jgi:uncharacterized membrane protein
MGLAALIIGIVALVLGFVPLCGMIAIVPAVVGLILGIVDVKKRSKEQQPKGKGVAGIVLNAAAIVVIIIWTLVFVASAPTMIETMEQAIEDANVTMVQPEE